MYVDKLTTPDSFGNILDTIIELFFSRLDYEVRNNKKEKKEKAAFAAYMKAKEEGIIFVLGLFLWNN